MLWKETAHGHLFVYWNGQLILKRRENSGPSVIFNSFGPPANSGDRSQNMDRETWGPAERSAVRETALV